MVGVLIVELRLAGCRTLKDKRSVIRPVIEGARSRHLVAAAETDHQDLHQLAELEFAAAAASERVVTETLDAVERFVWSQPGLEVIGSARRWVEDA